MTRRQGRRILLTAAALLLAAFLPRGASAQEGSVPPALQQSHAVAAPQAHAVQAEEPIAVDGQLDEPVWSAAPAVTEFTQLDPFEGRPASEVTEVRIAFDEQAIYIGGRLGDSGEVTTRLDRRDASLSESDLFVVVLDSYHDHQTAYRFATNPSGVRQDELISIGQNDSSWDPVWDVATSLDPEGWSVEMRIPFSQLRFRPVEAQVWGIQFERWIHRKQEQTLFAFTPKLERGGVPRFGHLQGIGGIRQGRRLELLPYVTGRAEYLDGQTTPGIDLENPYRTGSEVFGNAGLDVKYRVSSNITLDASVNPDFGQVEVDPAVINLTAFETRFDEKRPFFIEGAEIFRFGEGGPTGSTGRAPELLYSRRMGRSPQGSVPSGALYSDEPAATTILGAAKLTGKVGEGWSIGLLDVVTNRETARYIDGEGLPARAVVEAAANYVVGRVRRDANGGNTRIGGVFTAVNRDLGEDLGDRLHSAALTGGLDFAHEWAERTWRFSTTFSPSYVTGSAGAVARTQRTSTRYLQRPDATHLDYDPSAESLFGYYAMTEINKQAGAMTGRIALAAASPRYEVNDIGFQSYADRLIFDTHLQYNQVTPGRFLRSWNVGGGPDAIWNYAGQPLLLNFNLNGRYQWANYWGSGWRVEYTPETYDDRLTRGGPLSRVPRGYQASINLNTDTRKAYSGSGSLAWYGEEGGSWGRSLDLELGYQPRENWEIRIGPSLSRDRTAAQYVTTVIDPLATHTFANRYVFASLDQTTLGIESRVNVTFFPGLSLQMYAQPFISTGSYGTLKELRAPGTFEFVRYGDDAGTVERQPDGMLEVDPDGSGDANAFLVRDLDFDYRSLLGNAVLRWEWRQGSTLYLVWQQHREHTITGMDVDPVAQSFGRLDFGDDARELFRIRPDNIVALKVNYWLNP
ncbi:MAG: hypothetical protein GEU90_03385 [Gemmatimonas sp.]|nr:hypothetical protein [Gemmatimonas sp.]